MGSLNLKTLWRLLVLLIVVPLAVGATLWLLEQRGSFNLDHIDILLTKNNDQSRFMRPLVEDLDAQLEKLRGQSLWRINLIGMSHQLTALPWVAEIQMHRNWPDRLEIRIVPKEVKFLFVGKGGQLFPVMEDGTFLNPVSAEARPDVVLLRGDDFVQNKELLGRALKAFEDFPNDGSFSKKTISEIHFSVKEGFWATLMKDAINVKLGDDHVVVKADRVSQVLDYLEAHQLDARVIDANLTKKVLVRLRKGP